MRIVREELRKKAGVLGETMDEIMGERVKLVVRDPDSALPIGHGIPEKELSQIKWKGVMHVPQSVYLLLLRRIVRDGTEGLHNYKIHSGSGLQRILEAKEDKKTTKKKETAALAAVTTSKTGGTAGGRGGGATSSGGRSGGGGSGEGAGKGWSGDPPCTVCGMFCPKENGGCGWCGKDGKLIISKFASHEKNRFFNPSGLCQPSRSCMHKLESFHFPKAKVPVTDPAARTKLITAVREAISEYSVGQAATKQVNFAGQGDVKLKEQLTAMTKKLEKQERLVAKTAKTVAKVQGLEKKKKKGKDKKKRKAKKRRGESESDSDEESDDSSGGSLPPLHSDSESDSDSD